MCLARTRHQCGCGPKCDYEPAERDRVTIDETLTKSESGMSGPCNRETSACSVIQPRQYDGIREFVCPPREKTSGDKFNSDDHRPGSELASSAMQTILCRLP